jgi:hypothetical protein
MKKLPDINSFEFILCDDARAEPGDKITILGFYAGRDINFSVSAPPVHMQSLTFIYLFRSGEGDFDTKFSVIAPDNSLLVPETKMDNVHKVPGIAASVVIGFRPFVFNMPGKYIARLNLDGTTYDANFLVNIGPPSTSARV